MDKFDVALTLRRGLGRSSANFEIAINDMLKFNQNQAIVFSSMSRAISECKKFAHRYGLIFEPRQGRLYCKDNPNTFIYIFSKMCDYRYYGGIEINGNILADTPDCNDTEIMDILAAGLKCEY